MAQGSGCHADIISHWLGAVWSTCTRVPLILPGPGNQQAPSHSLRDKGEEYLLEKIPD